MAVKTKKISELESQLKDEKEKASNLAVNIQQVSNNLEQAKQELLARQGRISILEELVNGNEGEVAEDNS